MNKGWRPAEIAEAIDLPPGLAERWTVRGYYGSVSHNVKAVLQRISSFLVRRQPLQSPPLPAGAPPSKLFEYMGGRRGGHRACEGRLRQL